MSKIKIKWWQYFGLGSFVAGWIARAVQDGKIDKNEIQELVSGIIEQLGIEEIDID